MVFFVLTQTQPQRNSKVWFDMKMTLNHPTTTLTNSMSSTSQLLLTQFTPNFKYWILGSTTTWTTTKTTTKQHFIYYLPYFDQTLMEGVWDKQQQHHHQHQQQQNKNNWKNKYISAITDQISTKHEMITITTETTKITTRTKTTTHSTTKNNNNNKSQLLMTWIGPSFKARFLDQLLKQN